METEIICAFIAVGGTVLSACIAWLVSKSTASKEIEKMKLTWSREDAISSDEEFAEMAKSVAAFAYCLNHPKQTEAIGRVSAIRAKEDGALGELLDALYLSVGNAQKHEIERALTQVIEKKRNKKAEGPS